MMPLPLSLALGHPADEKMDIARVHKTLGSYRYRIEGYNGLSTRVGDSVESPEFFVCGHTWQLRIFPGGSLEQHRGYVSYYLASKSSRVARASYRLTVVNQLSGGEDETFASSGVRTFEAKGAQVDGWGRDRFMQATALLDQSLGFRVNDCVIFKVDITVFGELETQNSARVLAELHRRRGALDTCLASLLGDADSSDIALVACGGSSSHCERIPAHRCILMARSSVFAAMLRSRMDEALRGEVVITDIDAAVLRELLHFMYTDMSPEREVLAEHGAALLVAAVKYEVIGLIALCETHFCAQLTVDTAVPLLGLADGCGALSLKERALQLIVQNPQRFRQDDGLAGLREELRAEVATLLENSPRHPRGATSSSACGGGGGGGGGGGSDRRASCAIM